VSACVYALFGGVSRRIEAGARVGVHRFHAAAADAPSDEIPSVLADYAIDMLKSYAASMGIDPALIAIAAEPAPEIVRYLSREELRRYRVVTGG
jgi:hypothetical protein